MGIRNLGFIRELVNAFNINNYGSRANTNIVVEGNNIVVKFNCNKSSAKECLSQMAKDLIREYFLNEDVARHVFDLESFPFKFNKGSWTHSKVGAQLTVPIDSGVIFNLKMHFAEEFMTAVETQMIKEFGGDFQCIKEILNENIKQAKMNASSHYISCLLFCDRGIQTHFVAVLQAKMREHGYNYLDFYYIDDDKIYLKDVENTDFIKSVTEISKKRAGYNFNFPSDDDLKVRKYKDAIGELIFRLTGIAVCGYYCDNFTNKGRISKGDNFAFIPVVKEGNSLRYLKYEEADKINAKFSYNLLTDVRDQTEGAKLEGIDRIYAFSDRQIALLIPVIIENSVISKDGQLEIDPELPQRLQSPEPSPSRELSQIQVSPKRNQEEQIKESPRQPEKEKGTEVLYHTIDSGNLPQQSLSAAAVGASASVQEADIWLGSGSPKKHEALQSESSSSKRVDELEQGASGGFSASSESNGEYEEDRAKSESQKKHGIHCKLRSLFFSKSNQPDKNLERYDVRRGSTQSAPVPRVSKKPPFSKQNSFPGRRKAQSNPPSEVSSPAHLKDTSCQLPEIIVESAPPAEDKSQQLRPKASVSRNGSNRSNDSGFKSADPSPRSSLTPDAANLIQQPDISKSDRFSDKFSKEGSPDTSDEIKKQLPFIPFPQTQLTEPSSFPAMQYTGARKKVTGESDICPTYPWAVPSTAAFVPTSVSHAKSDIDELKKDFLRTMKVAKEEKFGSSESEYGHQWLDRERHRRSTKQVTKEEPSSNWVRG